jgi:hypothetical protein
LEEVDAVEIVDAAGEVVVVPEAVVIVTVPEADDPEADDPEEDDPELKVVVVVVVVAPTAVGDPDAVKQAVLAPAMMVRSRS